MKSNCTIRCLPPSLEFPVSCLARPCFPVFVLEQHVSGLTAKAVGKERKNRKQSKGRGSARSRKVMSCFNRAKRKETESGGGGTEKKNPKKGCEAESEGDVEPLME